LATAYVLFRCYEKDAESIAFETKSGTLEVESADDLLVMDFPAYELTQVQVTAQIEKTIGCRPLEAWLGRDLLCILDSEERVCNAVPDFDAVSRLDGLLLHISAKGNRYDCVSRSFGPKCGVAEDPVCGSGHCHILPYWANALEKQELVAYQASARGGVIYGSVAKIADGNGIAGASAIAQCFADAARGERKQGTLLIVFRVGIHDKSAHHRGFDE
jgi:predicted PhzF superfamily epimerase YddE/YHI9